MLKKCWIATKQLRPSHSMRHDQDLNQVRMLCFSLTRSHHWFNYRSKNFLINLKGINHRDIYFLKLSVKTPFRRSLSSKRVDFQPPRINGISGNSCPGGIAAIAMVHSRFVSPLTTLKCLRRMCLFKLGNHVAHEIKIDQMKYKIPDSSRYVQDSRWTWIIPLHHHHPDWGKRAHLTCRLNLTLPLGHLGRAEMRTMKTTQDLVCQSLSVTFPVH